MLTNDEPGRTTILITHRLSGLEAGMRSWCCQGKVAERGSYADLLSARDKAMLEVLYSSGIRVSELVELDMADLDLQEGVLRVKGKGRKDRLTPIGSQAIKALQRYFEMRSADPRLSAMTGGRVFLNKHGQSLSTRSV
jgi:integrase/recombinase XerC